MTRARVSFRRRRVGRTMLFYQYAPYVAAVAASYWVVFFISGPLCLALFPRLRQKSKKDQLGAFIRIPSLLNCAIVVPAALYILLVDSQGLALNRGA